jgi:hypothetical protein
MIAAKTTALVGVCFIVDRSLRSKDSSVSHAAASAAHWKKDLTVPLP